jgi:hypothetical protein
MTPAMGCTEFSVGTGAPTFSGLVNSFDWPRITPGALFRTPVHLGPGAFLVFAVLPLLQRPVVGLYLPRARLLRDDGNQKCVAV